MALTTVAAFATLGVLSLPAAESPAAGGPPLKLGSGPSCHAFSPDGKLLACANWERVTLTDVATGKELSQAAPDVGDTNCTYLAFSPDGKRFASLYYYQDRDSTETRHEVLLWEVTAGNKLRRAASLPQLKHWRVDDYLALNYLTFSPDGKLLAARFPGDDTLIWDTATGKLRLRLETQGLAVAFGPDSKELISVSRDGRVQRWDLATRKCVTPGGDAGRTDFLLVMNAFASADGSTVGLTDGTSLVFKDSRTGKKLSRFGATYAPSLSPDGKTVAFSRYLFDTRTRKELARFDVPGWAEYLPGGKALAFDHERALSVWDVDKIPRAGKDEVRPDPPPGRLEVKLTSRQDAYTLNLGGKTPEEFARRLTIPDGYPPPAGPEVDLVLIFRNAGDKKLDLSDIGGLHVSLVGDGAMNLPMTHDRSLLTEALEWLDWKPARPKPITLAPGETYSVPVKSLHGSFGQRSYWLLPGEYTLYARASANVNPAPEGAVSFTDGSTNVSVETPPLRVKVIAAPAK